MVSVPNKALCLAMAEGAMGFMRVSQASLLFASALMAIPSLMILVSALAPAAANRIANMAGGAVYFLVNIGNLLGESWGFYFPYGLLELALVVPVFVVALRWPRQAG